jgi:hypothetical protein
MLRDSAKATVSGDSCPYRMLRDRRNSRSSGASHRRLGASMWLPHPHRTGAGRGASRMADCPTPPSGVLREGCYAKAVSASGVRYSRSSGAHAPDTADGCQKRNHFDGMTPSRLVAASPTPPSGMLREGCYANGGSASGGLWPSRLVSPKQSIIGHSCARYRRWLPKTQPL